MVPHQELAQLKFLDYVIDFDGVEITGNYEGASEDGLPSGEGVLKSNNDDYSFSYEGKWKEGKIRGKGYLKYDKYVVHFPDVNREGDYKGDTKNGVASGYGVFKATNDYGEKYTYECEWDKGLPNGFGRHYFETNDTRMVGYFVDGDLEPTLVNVLFTASEYDDIPFEFTFDEADFIEDHSYLFPSKDLPSLAQYVDENLNYKMIEKKESAYNDSLMIVDPAYVISIDEYDGFFEGQTLSILLVSDNDFNVHYVIYPGEAADVYAEDYVGLVGYPIGFSAYENVSGTQTKCTVLLGCFITK